MKKQDKNIVIKNIKLSLKSKLKLQKKIDKLQNQLIENNEIINILVEENEKNRSRYVIEHKKYNNIYEQKRQLKNENELLKKRDKKLTQIEKMFEKEVDLSKLSKLISKENK